MSLRIGFDARLWHHTGIGRYIHNILTELADAHWVVWVAPADLAAARQAWPDAEIRVCAAPPFSLREQVFWARELRKIALGVFHSPHLNAPLACPVPLVVSVHDLIPLHFPDTISNPLGAWYYAVMCRLATRRASRVIAPSVNTTADLTTLVGTPETRIRTIHLAADGRFAVPADPDRASALRERLGLSGRYVLYAGQWKPYKNLGTLLAAFAGLAPAFEDVKLVLVGRVDPRAKHVAAAIAHHGLAARVVTTGYLDDELDLVALFQGAAVFAFPSRYEGFGLPPLEAMAAGVPVVASDAAALLEVVGDAALVVSAGDIAGWTAALASVLTDPAVQTRLVSAGRARAASFAWALTAAETRAVYAEVMPPK